MAAKKIKCKECQQRVKLDAGGAIPAHKTTDGKPCKAGGKGYKPGK